MAVQYWGLIANPKRYDIERAINERETDSWTTGRSFLAVGDRGVIWKTLGGSTKRGIIAFFHVVEASRPRQTEDFRDFQDPAPDNDVTSRAIVRYIRDEDLPYWYGPKTAFVLDRTTLPGAQQSLAKITPDQWNLLIEAIRSNNM